MDNKTKEVLSNAGLECLIPKFIDEFIGYDDLLGLTPDLIKELTPKIGFRSRLSIIIDKIKCNQRKEGEGSALTSTSSSSQGGSSISDDQLPENLPNETRESSSVSTASTVILNTAESENLVTNDSLERCPAFCYKSLVKLDLEALLKGNLVGCKLLQNCRGKSLKLKDRPFLSRLIIDNVLLQTRELKADDFIVLVNQIKRIFPGECEESYFIPSSKRGKHSLGLLPNHYRFMKRKLNDGKVLDEKTQEENAEELKITDEYLDKANWLKVNCDIGEVTSVWKETSSIRVKLLQESKGKTISEIIEEWPALKHTFGINLICIDFNTLYPNKGEKLIASWDVISHKLLGYMRENLTDFSTQLLLDSLSTCTDDARNFVIFKVIHKLFPPTVSVAPQKKRKYHPSVSESVESFILHLEPRYLLSSLASCEMLKGLVVAPLGAYPGLYYCWPYPVALCGIQALLLPFLLQQAAVSLTLLAVDRYYCLIHPSTYGSYSSKLTSISIVIGSWLLSCAFYVALFISAPNFFFNTVSGACEVFPTSHARLTFAACCLYFPSTMIMMYCYGTAFHTERTVLHRLVGATVTAPQLVARTSMNPIIASEKNYQLRMSRVMAVLSLSFIILVTPWTLRQIIAATTNYKMPIWLDYSVWIISETAGLLMLLVYWLLSPALRRATQHTLHNRVCCGNVLLETWDEAPIPPPKRGMEVDKAPSRGSSAPRSATTTPRHQVNGRPPMLNNHSRRHNGSVEMEADGEKFWGEILERAVSSTSLHNLQRFRTTNDGNYGVSSFCEIPSHFRPQCDLHPRGIRPV